jgi:hypothetical protein
MPDFKFEAWPTEFRVINQYFGANPQNYAQFGLPGHEGIDFQAPDGTKVFCVAPGKVAEVRTNPTGHNYGIHVKVNHQDNFQTTYAHLRQAVVSVGQDVAAGTLLGLADNTGNSFGSHLHLTLKKLGVQYKNWPYNITDPTPHILPLLGWTQPAGPYTSGWAFTDGITAIGGLAQVNSGGITLRVNPDQNSNKIAVVPAGTIMVVTGPVNGQYTPVNVPNSSIGIADPTPKKVDPPPPQTVATADGWAFTQYITVTGTQALVGQYGINLRVTPDRNGANIGLVKGGSTATVLGAAKGEYTPVRVRQTDFMGPFNLPDKPPIVPPTTPPTNTYPGWAFTQNLSVSGRTAIVGKAGINLRAAPDRTAANIGLVKEGASVTITGLVRGEYTPILARLTDIANPVSPVPTIAQPDPFPAGTPTPPPPPRPIPDTTPGWAFTTQITLNGNVATVGQYGINLRAEPRRDAKNLGFITGGVILIVTGLAQGEYTPVRVDDRMIKPPFDPAAPAAAGRTSTPVVNPDPPALGKARIGLHASADPSIPEAEFKEFADMRPGMIKVLSLHSGEAIARLAKQTPEASWIVRAYISLDNRNVGPEQFVNDTLNDVQRALNNLPGRDVVVELHNEPNLKIEGLFSSWADGAAFGTWLGAALKIYRARLPGVRFIYPGLSPGSAVNNFKHDHIQFIEASRAAVEACDGLGVHIYWSSVYPMATALGVLDDYISRFRSKPIWVTEASNNKGGATAAEKATQYLQFWNELQKRATVQGVTFFVASASSPDFAEEVWVGRGIGNAVGKR